MSSYTLLKDEARKSLGSYFANGRSWTHLNRAINQTRLAIALLRQFTPVHRHGIAYVSHKAMEG